MIKKMILAAALVLLMATSASAFEFLLQGATATGAGDGLVLRAPVKNHTVECHYTDADASISAITVALEGTIDRRTVADGDANWYAIGTHAFVAGEITAKSAMWHVVDKPVNRVRANITVLTGEAAGDVVNCTYQPMED